MLGRIKCLVGWHNLRIHSRRTSCGTLTYNICDRCNYIGPGLLQNGTGSCYCNGSKVREIMTQEGKQADVGLLHLIGDQDRMKVRREFYPLTYRLLKNQKRAE